MMLAVAHPLLSLAGYLMMLALLTQQTVSSVGKGRREKKKVAREGFLTSRAMDIEEEKTRREGMMKRTMLLQNLQELNRLGTADREMQLQRHITSVQEGSRETQLATLAAATQGTYGGLSQMVQGAGQAMSLPLSMLLSKM